LSSKTKSPNDADSPKIAREPTVRVALIVPKSNLYLSVHGPPMNLAYIASYLRKVMPNAQVKIFDGSIGVNVEKSITIFQPHIIGVTATTPQAPSAYRLGDEIRVKWPQTLTVIGGVHSSVMPQEASEHFDVVIVGEGEKKFSQVVANFVSNRAQKGILQGEPIEDLDEIPSPAFDLLNMAYYLRNGIHLPTLKPSVLGMVTSRGCPYRCAFCWNSFRKTKVRYFSAERIVEEILYLKKTYGVTQVYFLDDEFLINKERIEKLSTLFRETGISEWFRWACSARATTLNVQLLKKAKAMGCVLVNIGLESGTERVLKYLKSGSSTVSINEKALEIGAEAGMVMGGSIIFGTPTETLAEMKQTFKWIVSHPNLKFIGVSILTPYPGTNVWDYCVKHKLIVGKVNYEELIQDASPDVNTFHIASLPRKTFRRFMKDVNNATWFMSKVRPNPSIKEFLKTMGYTASWKTLATHPALVLRELQNVVKHQVVSEEK
jgi:anaerobic magnesium-protoporphyrin IX monomethyl ester cyclase